MKKIQRLLIKALNLENNPRLKYLFANNKFDNNENENKNLSTEDLEKRKESALAQANIALSNKDQKASMLVYQIEENFYYTILNFIILLSNFNPIEQPETKNLVDNKVLIKNNNSSSSEKNKINNNESVATAKSLISEHHREMIKFNLNIINLIIFGYQRRNKVQMISEYYIEKYLKDVLEVLTSKNFNLEIKSDFLLATITFVSYFDGYESILFQNGLFHSILSDLTSTKFEENPLEVLSFKESIDQDFFNTILQFLYKTQSFKEIPIHFLNKVLEIPRNGVYPYRIDNVIFSLRKKRTLDENTLNELVIPRLIYELEHFWQEEKNTFYYEYVHQKTSEQMGKYQKSFGNVDFSESAAKHSFVVFCAENLKAEFSKEQIETLKANLFCVENKDKANSERCALKVKRNPTISERTNLVIKLFKIIFSIFRHNTNSSSLSYYENKMTESVNNFFTKCLEKLKANEISAEKDSKLNTINNNKNSNYNNDTNAFYYESIMLACMDLIDLICNYLPSAISSLVDAKIFSNLFSYLKLKIPKQTNILNLIFKNFYSLALNEEGSKFLTETGNEILTTLFDSFKKDDYIINNTFSIHNFYTDDFFTPFSLFLRINNGNEINKFFFEKIHQLIIELIKKLENILEDKDQEIKLSEFLEINKTQVSNLDLKQKAFKETPFNFLNYKFSYIVNLISHFLVSISQEEKELLTKDGLINLEKIFIDFFDLAFNPLMLLSVFTNVFSVSILKSIFNKNSEKMIKHVTALYEKNLKILNLHNANLTEIFESNHFDNTNNNNKNSNLMEIEDFQNDKIQIISEPNLEEDYISKYSKFNQLLLDIQKDKILSKLVHFVEYTLRKMYNVSKHKYLFHKIIPMNSIVMLYLLKRQRNFETYMSPVNDCILVINQKFYSKFLSSNLSENIFSMLIENTKKEKIKLSEKTNLKDIVVFNKHNYLDVQVELNLANNFRIEFFESNNPFNWEIMDYNSKMLINSQMPVIDFFINLSKAIRKNLRFYTENEISIYNTWQNIAYSMVLLIDSLDINNELERVKERILVIARISKNLKRIESNENKDESRKNTLDNVSNFNTNVNQDKNLYYNDLVNEENMKKDLGKNWKYVIEKLIEFINIVNNMNIILSEKTVSGYMIFQFYKMGGIEKIIDICEFFVNLGEILAFNFGSFEDSIANEQETINKNNNDDNNNYFFNQNQNNSNSKFDKKTSFSNYDFYFSENSENYMKSSKSIKIPVVLSLLLKNLWNVVNSIIMKIIKNNYEQMINYGLLLVKEGFNSTFEFNVFIKFYLFSLVTKRFLGFDEKKKNEKKFQRKQTSGLKRISKYSFSFINIFYAICDSALNTYKALLAKEKALVKESELVTDLLVAGFNKLDVMSAMRDQNHKAIDQIVNFIIHDLDHSNAEYENYFNENQNNQEENKNNNNENNNNNNNIANENNINNNIANENNNNNENTNVNNLASNQNNNNVNNQAPNENNNSNNDDNNSLINQNQNNDVSNIDNNNNNHVSNKNEIAQMEIEEETKFYVNGVEIPTETTNFFLKEFGVIEKTLEDKTKKEVLLNEKILRIKSKVCNNYLSEEEKQSLQKVKQLFQNYLPDKKLTDVNNLEFKNAEIYFTNLHSKFTRRSSSDSNSNKADGFALNSKKETLGFDLEEKIEQEINNNFNFHEGEKEKKNNNNITSNVNKKEFGLEIKNALIKNDVNSTKLYELYQKYKIDCKQYEKPYNEIPDPKGECPEFLKDPVVQETIKKLEQENIKKYKQESKNLGSLSPDDNKNKNFEKIKNLEKDEFEHLKNVKSFNFPLVKEHFENLFSHLYDSILTDELYQNRIMQIRKMNLVFRLRDILSSKSVESYLLVPFLKELFALECDNYIELQNETEFSVSLNEKLKKFLHDRMLINYIISKDRLKESNIFENLNVDEISDFFINYDVIGSSLDRINNIISIVQSVFLNVNSKDKNQNLPDFDEQQEEIMQNIKQIIYELLFVVHIYLQFINYFNEMKNLDPESNKNPNSNNADGSKNNKNNKKDNQYKIKEIKEEEKNNVNENKDKENSEDDLKDKNEFPQENNLLNSKIYSKAYFEIVIKLIETQNKLTNFYGMEKQISILDEANLIIIFSSIVESFNNDSNLTQFIEKGYVREMLKIRKTHSKQVRENNYNISFNGSEIKYKIVFDEIFRIFLFHLFEDNSIQQNLLESVTYYIFANYLHSKEEKSYTENFLSKINSKSKKELKVNDNKNNNNSNNNNSNNNNLDNENEIKPDKDEIKEESKDFQSEILNTTKNLNNTTNYKTTENSDVNKNIPLVEMNFDDYLNTIFRLMPKDNEILVKMLRKIASVEYRSIQSKEKKPRKIYNTKNMNSRKDSENKDKLLKESQESSEKKAKEDDNQESEENDFEEENSDEEDELNESDEEEEIINKFKKIGNRKLFGYKKTLNNDFKSASNQHVLMIRILPEYVPNILSILNEMKTNPKENPFENLNLNLNAKENLNYFNNVNNNNNNLKENKDFAKDREYILADLNSGNNFNTNKENNILINSFSNINASNFKKNPITDFSASKAKMTREIKKNLNDNLERIHKDFGNTRNKLINQILKHIWDICEEGEREIEKNLDKILSNNTNNNNYIVNNKTHFNSQQKYLFDLDTILIGLGNLIHTYPSVISVVLKFHRAITPSKPLKESKAQSNIIPATASNPNQLINHNFLINNPKANNADNVINSSINNQNNNFYNNNSNNLNSNNQNNQNNFENQNFNINNNQAYTKNSSSFISFLFRNVFYVMNFYRNCTYSKENSESIMKDKEDLIRRMGYEPNSHQAILESFRNSNLINFMLNALCLKRRIMTKDEIFLVSNSRRKVLREIDSLLSETNKHLADENTKKICANSMQLVNSNNIKQLVYLKIASFALYTFTDFHDSSHVYSQFNPFEISRAIVSKDYSIIKSLTAIMKNLNLTDEYHFSLHKLNTLLLSEIFKYVKLSNKKNPAITSYDDSSHRTPKKRSRHLNRGAAAAARRMLLGNRGESALTEIPINVSLNNQNIEVFISAGAIGENEAEESQEDDMEMEELEEENSNSNSNSESSNSENDLEEESLEEEDSEEANDSQELYYSISSENEDFSGNAESGDSLDSDLDEEDLDEDDQEEIDNFMHNNNLTHAIDSEENADQGSEENEDPEDFSQEEDEEFSQNEPGENDSITDFHDEQEDAEGENANAENSIVHFHNAANNQLSQEEESASEESEYESENNYQHAHSSQMRGRSAFNFLNRFSRSHNSWGGLNIRSNSHVQSNLGEIPSILINSGIYVGNAFNSEDITDELLYANSYEKSHKNQIFYIEDNIVFPFVLYVLQEDLYEFYRPGVYISMINKLRKNQVDVMNNVFLYRYICPFECKFLRNLYFSHNYAKEKFITAYTKEFSKMEIDYLSFGNKESFKMYTSAKDNSEAVKSNVLKLLGVEAPKEDDLLSEAKDEINFEDKKKKKEKKNLINDEDKVKKEVKYDFEDSIAKTDNKNNEDNKSVKSETNRSVKKNEDLVKIEEKIIEQLKIESKKEVLENQMQIDDETHNRLADTNSLAEAKNKDETISDSSESVEKEIKNSSNTESNDSNNNINNNNYNNEKNNNQQPNSSEAQNEAKKSSPTEKEHEKQMQIREETKDQKDENNQDEIDPEFLQCIPEDLREEILQNQRRLRKSKPKLNPSSRQVYDVNEIDLEILNELPADIVNDLVNTMGFNIPGGVSNLQNNSNLTQNQNANANLNNNSASNNHENRPPQEQGIDWANFLATLSPDLREDILINLPPEAINQLPQEYVDEYNALIEQHYSAEQHQIVNVHTPPPERVDGNFNNPFFHNYFEFKINKENKKFSLKPLQYNFEEILNAHKYNKDQAALLMQNFDDEFLENLICFNIKHTCKISPKSKITNNQYWILINHLIQNSSIRYKILDLLFILWNLDSIRLKELLKENPNCVNNNALLKYFYELLIQNNLLEEFFYDDYDQFIKLFCTSKLKEMKKFFLDTFYTEKGEYIRSKTKSDNKSAKTFKRYLCTKDSLAIKEVLNLNFEKEENVLSNLLRIMLVNSKSDIKKIFALKIFSNVISNCLKNTEDENDSENKNKDNNNNNENNNKDKAKNKSKSKNANNVTELKISISTMEMIIQLFYNFETVLLINKDKKSNNPTHLICEMIGDTKCFKNILNVILSHVEKLNESVSYEMDHFLTNSKIDINAYSKPLPENILFKIIKLVNKLNQVIYKDKYDSGNILNVNVNANNVNVNVNEENNVNLDNYNNNVNVSNNINVGNSSNEENVNNDNNVVENALNNNNNQMEIDNDENQNNNKNQNDNNENNNQDLQMDIIEEEEKVAEANTNTNNLNNVQSAAVNNNNINNNINNKKEQKVISANKNKVKKIEKIKSELSDFVKKINLLLIKCWEKLNHLLFEISKIMKEDQKTMDPKLNRLIPFIEAFITLSHLQFLPEKFMLTINPFIIEKSYKNTPRKTPQSHYGLSHANSPLHLAEGLDYNEFFYRFCDKNKKIINLILRRYPKMFPNEILIKISRFLDLENKKKYFRYELKKLKAEHSSNIQLNIRRDHIFMDSYHHFRNKKPEDLRGKLTIRFIGEEAIDAGGVKREWFTLLSKEMFNPHFMLFKLTSNANTYLPNNNSGMFESDHLEIFKFIGRVIAKAIFDGFMLDCYFTRGFYKLICNIPLTYHDLADYDPEYYKSIKWFMENDISDMGDMWTFSYEEDNFGQLEVIDLIPNGRNISVTQENKFDYVQKLCFAKLFGNIKPQVEAFQKGFYELIPLKLISIFDPRELELVISGLPTIDCKFCFLFFFKI